VAAALLLEKILAPLQADKAPVAAMMAILLAERSRPRLDKRPIGNILTKAEWLPIWFETGQPMFETALISPESA